MSLDAPHVLQVLSQVGPPRLLLPDIEEEGIAAGQHLGVLVIDADLQDPREAPEIPLFSLPKQRMVMTSVAFGEHYWDRETTRTTS